MKGFGDKGSMCKVRTTELQRIDVTPRTRPAGYERGAAKISYLNGSPAASVSGDRSGPRRMKEVADSNKDEIESLKKTIQEMKR